MKTQAHSDLFPETFTRRGSSIVPPTPDEVAAHRRDRGIASVAKHAQNDDPGWQDRAIGYVVRCAALHPNFMAEDAREMAELYGLAKPADKRAWGNVMRTAARRGLVRSCGYAPARSSHLSPKVLWTKVE